MLNILAVFLLLLSACSVSTTQTKEEFVYSPAHIPRVEPASVNVSGPTWSLELPSSNWSLVSNEKNDELQNVIIESKNGVVINITAATLPEELSDVEFGEQFVMFLAAKKVKIISAAKVKFNSHPGAVAIFVDGEKIAVQIAVGSGRVAHVMRCVGSAELYESVITECQSALTQFTLK